MGMITLEEKDLENLNSVWKIKMATSLVNHIAQFMVKNEMTLEILDVAYNEINKWYRRDATVKS